MDEYDLRLTSITRDLVWASTQFFQGMRKVIVRRGTENGAAKFAAVFGISTKNQGGGIWAPIGSRVNLIDSPSFSRRQARTWMPSDSCIYNLTSYSNDNVAKCRHCTGRVDQAAAASASHTLPIAIMFGAQHCCALKVCWFRCHYHYLRKIVKSASHAMAKMLGQNNPSANSDCTAYMGTVFLQGISMQDLQTINVNDGYDGSCAISNNEHYRNLLNMELIQYYLKNTTLTNSKKRTQRSTQQPHCNSFLPFYGRICRC